MKKFTLDSLDSKHNNVLLITKMAPREKKYFFSYICIFKVVVYKFTHFVVYRNGLVKLMELTSNGNVY